MPKLNFNIGCGALKEFALDIGIGTIGLFNLIRTNSNLSSSGKLKYLLFLIKCRFIRWKEIKIQEPM